MTREEEIRNAKKTFYERIYEEGYYYDPRDCFEEGAEWADEHPNLESLWHDASEEPNIDEDVVLYDCCGNFVTEFYNGDVTWRNIVLYYKATMWAYVKDLLPKGGEL